MTISEAVGSVLQFCAHCDYAISRIEMDSYRGDLDKTMCPRCGMCRLSMFYSYGSQCHINRLEAWDRGEVTVSIEVQSQGKHNNAQDHRRQKPQEGNAWNQH